MVNRPTPNKVCHTAVLFIHRASVHIDLYTAEWRRYIIFLASLVYNAVDWSRTVAIKRSVDSHWLWHWLSHAFALPGVVSGVLFPPLQQTSSAWQISLPLLTSPDAATGKRSIAPGWVMMPSFAEWFLRFAVVASCVWVKIPYRVVLPLWHSGSGGCLLVCLWIWRNILRHSEQLFYLGSLRLEAGMN